MFCSAKIQNNPFSLSWNSQFTNHFGDIKSLKVKNSCLASRDYLRPCRDSLCSQGEKNPKDLSCFSAVRSRKQPSFIVEAQFQPNGPSQFIRAMPTISKIVAYTGPDDTTPKATPVVFGNTAALSPLLSNIMVFGEFGVMLILANVL
jgi:hypothetical protein